MIRPLPNCLSNQVNHSREPVSAFHKHSLAFIVMNEHLSIHRPSRSITILDLRDSPWVDGPGRTILDCAESLQGQGFRFLIGTFVHVSGKESAYVTEARRRNLEVVLLQESGQFDWRILTQLRAIMDSNHIDVVHTHDPRTNVIGLICAWLQGKPVVTTVHGWIANTFKRKVYRAIDKFFLRFFDAIISVSERTRELIRKAWIADRKITVISNALKIEHYQPNRQDRTFRHELGLDDQTALIANIGRLSPEKGHMDFLVAAGEVVREFQNVRFVLIGTGPEQDRLEKFVGASGLATYVHFAGYRTDMISIYNSLDLVVQSSYTEGMPNVVLEALLMEVPVIASDVGGTAEVMDNGRNGLLNQPGNPAQLAKDICDFLADREQLQRCTRQGRSSILDRFDHRKRVQKLSQLYQSLMKTG